MGAGLKMMDYGAKKILKKHVITPEALRERIYYYDYWKKRETPSQSRGERINRQKRKRSFMIWETMRNLRTCLAILITWQKDTDLKMVLIGPRQLNKLEKFRFYSYKAYENCHTLRVRFSHGAARDIHISDETLHNAECFYNDVQNSRLRKRRQAPKLPDGTFRSKPFVKEFRWKGYGEKEYYFRFMIVQEYQKRAYDDGTRFEGYGYTIYVKDAPYMHWCIEHNREYGFHFYNAPVDSPSICWNKLITDFADANAVMVTWSNRYKTILDKLLQNKSIDESKLNRASQRRGILPTGTFRTKDCHGKKHNNFRKVIHMSQQVYDEILEILGTQKPELGGMLGWKDDQDYIDTFVFDKNAKVGFSEYNPDTAFLMNVMDTDWERNGVYLAGFAHSHPRDCGRLSDADIEYAQRIMKEFDMKYIFMPIVTSSFEYRTEINPYIVDFSGKTSKCNIELFNDNETRNEEIEIDPDKIAEINAQFDRMAGVSPIELSDKPKNLPQDETFSRIASVINLEHMKNCSIIGIGCGGARGFYEDMARIGVGKFILMDGDISSRSNIASQNGYISEIGKPKVEAVKRRLLDINDEIDVETFQCMLDDQISDEWFKKTIITRINTKNSILCAFTDDFWAQARAQQLALKYQIPYLAAQHHQYGESSEVFYWYPGVSEYTSDVVFSDRYKAYQNGYKNTVTSEGSPIYNTTRLNSLCEKIATGMLTFSDDIQNDCCSFLKFRPKQNLILIRQKCLDYCNSPVSSFFCDEERYYFDDSAWIDPFSIITVETDEVCNKTK